MFGPEGPGTIESHVFAHDVCVHYDVGAVSQDRTCLEIAL